MAERPEQIARHIESARSELGSNLHELEAKVRHEADWKTHFERNPMTLLGLAFGGGVLLASMLGGSRRGANTPPPAHQNGRPGGGLRNTQISDSWGTLKGALLGLAGAKVRDALNEALPGFSEQYEKLAREKPASTSPWQGHEFESTAHRV
ncbi:MAG: DUF3618 domain-containing protein [Acidobacteriota bacterium]|nr:DUF3618 domain-containing protein [Acidobacteriota bacterium]